MEKLNLKKLFKKDIEIDNTKRIEKKVISNSNIIHKEFDIDSKKYTTISGSINIGFSQTVAYLNNSPIIEKSEFFPNGKLKSKITMYCGVAKETKRGIMIFPTNIIYPIGKAYAYDANGLVIAETDYDKLLAFSIDQVKMLLSSRNIDVDRSKINGSSGIWKIFYFKSTSRKSQSFMEINGITGEIISDIHNIRFVDD
jgi:hypothetical protein